MPDWRSLARSKREAILQSIPQNWQIPKVPPASEAKDVTGAYIQQFLTRREIEFTETDAVHIAANVAAGTWTAVDVTRAFCHRAAIAHQLVSCLHETFFDAALADAQALDDYYREHRCTKGPLHGVPVSLKDQFHVKNVETTMGYTGWIGTFEGKKNDPRKGTYESEMVRELRNLGAILYCKTSVPYTLMSPETVNNIIGYTYNPKNRHLSSGGSSGGEGALIGLKGSPLGLGTDIGGSIRIPAAFNGLYGLRPSSGRLPYEGMANSMDGQNSVLSVVGPLATTAGGATLLVKSILSQEPWLYDPLVVELPWRSEQEQAVLDIINHLPHKKLCFGLFKHDGTIHVHPPVSRAIDIVAEALTQAGHQIIPWDPPKHEEGNEYVVNAYQYDGGEDVYSSFELSGEDIASQIQFIYGTERKSEKTASEIAGNNRNLRQWKKRYFDYWNSTASLTESGEPVDAILAPIAPYAAARPGRYKHFNFNVFANALDATAIVVPVTQADSKIDRVGSDFQAISDLDKELTGDYDAELYDGAHVSVQLVGRRFTEEKMLTIASHVGQLLEQKTRGEGPMTTP